MTIAEFHGITRFPFAGLLVLLFLISSCDSGKVTTGDTDVMERVLTIPTDDPFPTSSFLSVARENGSFPLVENGIPCNILVSGSDYPGVRRVAELFRKDLDHVSGQQVQLTTGEDNGSGNLVITGTIGKGGLVDRLAAEGKIDVTALEGKWEQFLIIPVRQPVEGVDNALVIAGSDKRGTIFGMFELSGQMGVSPWYWWADVPVKQRKNIFVKPGVHTLGEPGVKYRGIFLNDEAPALSGWAREKFGGFNHEFYEKVFELLLRNKANYLWPAMWRPSAFADDDPENSRLADEYGIAISTTHHEPMMRAHDEWSRYGIGEWNYETNRENLREFWRGGIERIGSYESVVTLGMRGDGDEAMGEETAVELMKTIIADQRSIISEVTGKAAEETPQVWAIYKEVQDYYDKGMRVDDDILILFCDDNWGNVRILPKEEDFDHKGGYGMYYHFDFVGGPISYRWVNVTQIERVWEQMNLSYQWGVQDLWIVNVGDLKPMELPTGFFLDFAWHAGTIAADDLPGYYENWARQQFGDEHATEIAEILALSTKYSARRTPEMLKPDTYSLENYREADNMLGEYNHLLNRSREVYDKLPESHKAAYYQLVLFPVEILNNLNEMYVAAGKNRQYADQGRASVNHYAEKVKDRFFKDAELTHYYHDTLSGGKWNHMMAQTHIGYTSWFNPPVNRMPEVSYIQPQPHAGLGYVVEHGVSEGRWQGGLYGNSFPAFDSVNDQRYYVEIFNKGREKLSYAIRPENDWILLSSDKGEVLYEEKVYVSVDWDKVPEGEETGEMVISGAGEEYTVKIPLRTGPRHTSGYVENNGVVSIEAARFSGESGSDEARWTVVPNMGRTGDAITVVPANARRPSPGEKAPYVTYEFTVFDGGDLKVDAYLSPTLNYRKNEGLKYAIAIDDEEPQIINMHEGDTIPDWEYPDWWNNAVTDRIRKKRTEHPAISPGKHTLKVWMVDPGVVFQKFIIDAGGLRSSYLGPPESKYVK